MGVNTALSCVISLAVNASDLLVLIKNSLIYSLTNKILELELESLVQI